MDAVQITDPAEIEKADMASDAFFRLQCTMRPLLGDQAVLNGTMDAIFRLATALGVPREALRGILLAHVNDLDDEYPWTPPNKAPGDALVPLAFMASKGSA